MSRDQAMERYVDEMKSVAQEVLDTMPVNEQTASLLHHFKPLYRVVEGMPRPPEPLLRLQDGLGCSDGVDRQAEMKDEDEDEDEDEERGGPQEDLSLLGGPDPDQDLNLSVDTVHHDSGVSEGFPLASDSESEVFCDSVDSMEQLGSAKIPLVKSNGFHNGHVFLESSPFQNEQRDSRPGARRVGAGQGGEVAEEGKGQGPSRRSQNRGRGGSSHNWRERQSEARRPRRGESWPRRRRRLRGRGGQAARCPAPAADHRRPPEAQGGHEERDGQAGGGGEARRHTRFTMATVPALCSYSITTGGAAAACGRFGTDHRRLPAVAVCRSGSRLPAQEGPEEEPDLLMKGAEEGM
ncbi:acyl-CoA-binding domain-containing protein 4 isoform X2 [Brachionichthys hirsutus]|uniref:acyl-CoA-binding domain-containing protein 4 isoform X2 n=1 Tax=Brachionichthys hirsutus TaxID=412623 RepID=UPI00360510C5